MAKVIIVGGGASGLVASIISARNNNEVILLERNDSLAKKILITGNGKCNYWNEDQDLKHYHSSNKELISEIITKENQDKVLKFFDKLGVVPNIKNGYYYPYSNQAVSIKTSLVNEVESLGIKVVYNAFVVNIEKENNKFIVYTENEKFIGDNVIIATGSKSVPKTGSDGSGYKIASSFGHKIIPVLPALTQVYGSANYYKNWNGIRQNVVLSLYENDELKKVENGEIHLTNYGLSGICTFNLSESIAKGLNENKKEILYINFIFDLKNTKDFIQLLDERNDKLNNRTIAKLFDGFMNYKLVYLFLRLATINPDDYWDNLNSSKKETLAKLFLEHKVEVSKVNDFSSAQVCSGGVSLSEINLKTMESLKVKGLYFTGEILDINGDCGGYNLGFAWLSGIIAGESVGKND